MHNDKNKHQGKHSSTSPHQTISEDNMDEKTAAELMQTSREQLKSIFGGRSKGQIHHTLPLKSTSANQKVPLAIANNAC